MSPRLRQQPQQLGAATLTGWLAGWLARRMELPHQVRSFHCLAEQSELGPNDDLRADLPTPSLRLRAKRRRRKQAGPQARHGPPVSPRGARTVEQKPSLADWSRWRSGTPRIQRGKWQTPSTKCSPAVHVVSEKVRYRGKDPQTESTSRRQAAHREMSRILNQPCPLVSAGSTMPR